MPRTHRHHESVGQLKPTWTQGDLVYERQIELMTELRDLSNSIPDAYRARDELLYALATSGSLSRRDMATATGLNKSRVDQIISEMAAHDQDLQSAAATERVRRHLPA
jgi:hypothetical protein